MWLGGALPTAAVSSRLPSEECQPRPKPPGLRDSHRHSLSFWLGVLVLDCEVGRAPATRSALATAQVATAMWGQQVVRSSVLSVRVKGLVPLVIREGCMEVVALE